MTEIKPHVTSALVDQELTSLTFNIRFLKIIIQNDIRVQFELIYYSGQGNDGTRMGGICIHTRDIWKTYNSPKIFFFFFELPCTLNGKLLWLNFCFKVHFRFVFYIFDGFFYSKTHFLLPLCV